MIEAGRPGVDQLAQPVCGHLSRAGVPMLLSDVFQAFTKGSPISVMARAAMEHALSANIP